MITKEYLSQAYRVDQRITNKLEQVFHLRELATKATATLADAPAGAPNPHRMEDVIAKMIDLEQEINADIDYLVDLKRNLMRIIKGVENPELQTLLELRYLCFKSWEEIAVLMGYASRHVFNLHARALINLEAQQTVQ